MRATLPPELLFQIATLVRNNGTSLAPLTSVCRSWQAAFEPLIYYKLSVYSDDEHKGQGQGGISLRRFKKLTSGDRAIRRTYIRNLDYNILVPYEISDWVARKDRTTPEAYTTGNPVRKNNDIAFQEAIFTLFQELHSWSQSSSLRLNMAIRGFRRDPAPEPYTRYSEIAADYRWDYRDGRTSSVPPYRARFTEDVSDLPLLPCIKKLSFLNREPSLSVRHQIWTGALRTIIHRCTNIVELELELDEFVRPDHLEYIQARREALSSLIGSIPQSLRALRYRGCEDAPWKPAMSPLNVTPSGVDSVSFNLRNLSTHLEQLKLANTTIAYDFLCPLDEKGKPKLDSLDLNWPHLETIELESVPPYLASGEPTFHNDPEDDIDFDDEDGINTWEDVICDAETGWTWPELRTEEHFHRLLTSLGYAARRMPRLRSMKVEVESHHKFTVYLRKKDQIVLEWECWPPYQPDIRVAEAWNFDLNDVESDPMDEETSYVRLRTWPPNISI